MITPIRFNKSEKGQTNVNNYKEAAMSNFSEQKNYFIENSYLSHRIIDSFLGYEQTYC